MATAIGFDSLEKLREAIEAADPARIRPGEPDADQAGPAWTRCRSRRSSRCRGAWWRQEFDQIWQRVEADRKADKLDEEDKGKDEATS